MVPNSFQNDPKNAVRRFKSFVWSKLVLDLICCLISLILVSDRIYYNPNGLNGSSRSSGSTDSINPTGRHVLKLSNISMIPNLIGPAGPIAQTGPTLKTISISPVHSTGPVGPKTSESIKRTNRSNWSKQSQAFPINWLLVTLIIYWWFNRVCNSTRMTWMITKPPSSSLSINYCSLKLDGLNLSSSTKTIGSPQCI